MNPKGSGVELDLVPVACAMCGIAETEPRPVFEGYDYEYGTCQIVTSGTYGIGNRCN